MKKDKLEFYDIFYLFIFGCVFGWTVEVIWSYFKRGYFINHSAVVIGPFNTIYGIGAILLTLALYKIKDNDYVKIFVSSFLAGSVIEYVTSFFMEHTMGFIPWNYHTKFMHINGRICLIYSIFWGLLGIFWIKVIYPRVVNIIKNTNHKRGYFLMKALTIFLILDFCLTFCAVHRAKEYERGIEPNNQFEQFLDDHYGVEFLNNMYNNRWNRK